MHYYKRNLGDYAKKTGRLSILQHGVYNLLIDCCYDREQFPTIEEAIEWTWASSKEEVEAVEFVLRRFFTLEDGRYVQKRIAEEIAEYRAKAETNRRVSIAREQAKRARVDHESCSEDHESCTSRSPVVAKPQPNQEPRTSNQEPREKERGQNAADAAKTPRARAIPDGFPGQDEFDWCRQERADLAVETVAATFRDYHLAKGSTMKSWPAAWRTWVRKERLPLRPMAQPYKTALEKQAEVIAEITGRNRRWIDESILDMEVPAHVALARN
jgi:uncharacterized protein YdaU (DUF1376 family)